MRAKYEATDLRAMALACAIPGAPCEARAFAAHHDATLAADNHLAYVEAFVLQLGDHTQHAAILSLLSSCTRGFSQHKIAYKPPGARQLHAALDVARWVGMRLDGGLAHAYVRSRRAGTA